MAVRNPTPTGSVSFLRLFLSGWGWITVFVVPAFFVLGGIGLYSAYVAARLVTEGVETEAVITAKRYRDADGDSRTNDREIHYLEYTFSVDGEAMTDTSRVSEAFSNSVRRLETVPLRYVASDPMINEVEPGAYVHEARGALLWLAGILAVAGPVLWRQRRRARDMIWVRDHGEARIAVVTSHQGTGLQVNDKSAYRLHWKDANGATGRTTLVNRHALEKFPVGSEITLYHDPSGGRPPVWQAEVGLPKSR